MRLQNLSANSAQISENAKLQLKTVTPIHIGGRTQIGANRLLITNQIRAIIDEEKLFHRFRQMGVVDDYLNQAIDGDSRLSQFLNSHNWFAQHPNDTTRDSFAMGVAAYQLDWYRGIPAGYPTRIRPFIRDGKHSAYIPGTSIKGAIRSAVLYGQLLKLKQENRSGFDRFIDQKIRHDLPRVASTSVNPAIEIGLIEEVLQDFDALAPDDRVFRPGETSLRDFLKALMISDSTPVPDGNNLQLCQVQWVSEGNPSHSSRGWHFSLSGNEFPTSVRVEVIPEETILSCDGAIDKFTVGHLKKRNGSIFKPCFSDLQSVFALMKCFAKDLLAFERGFLDYLYSQNNDPLIRVALDEYDRIIAEEPNLRIGWGSGTISITILRLLLDGSFHPSSMRILDQADIEAIRAQFFPSHHQSRYGKNIKYFPKARRFIVTPAENPGDSCEEQSDLITPLGWCKLEAEGGTL